MRKFVLVQKLIHVSPFQGKDHFHILTGDLRKIDNSKLGKLLCRGLESIGP